MWAPKTFKPFSSGSSPMINTQIFFSLFVAYILSSTCFSVKYTALNPKILKILKMNIPLVNRTGVKNEL